MMVRHLFYDFRVCPDVTLRMMTGKPEEKYLPVCADMRSPWRTRALSQYKDGDRFGISIIKIRRSHDRLIFIMGIPIPVRRHLYIGTGPRGPFQFGMRRFIARSRKVSGESTRSDAKILISLWNGLAVRKQCCREDHQMSKLLENSKHRRCIIPSSLCETLL